MGSRLEAHPYIFKALFFVENIFAVTNPGNAPVKKQTVLILKNAAIRKNHKMIISS